MTDNRSVRVDVAVLGAAAMDWVAHVPCLPGPDGIAYADRYTPMPGGTGGNVAVGVRRLGHGSRFLGVLGNDENGHTLMDAFIDSGVDTCAIRIDPGDRSASCFIAVDDAGERLIFSLGGAALYDKPEQILPEWLAGVKVLFIADAFQDVALAAIRHLAPAAQVIFNPGGLMASAGDGYLAPFFTRSHVLIVSRRECQMMTGIDDPEAAAHELARRGPGVVLVTLGSRGALVLDHGRIIGVPAFPARSVIDTTGAGDAFSSGVIAGHLEGLDWVEAARLGCAVASLKVGTPGARAGLPDREQVRSLMDGIDIKSIGPR